MKTKPNRDITADFEQDIWVTAGNIENKRDVIAPPRLTTYYFEVKELLAQALTKQKEALDAEWEKRCEDVIKAGHTLGHLPYPNPYGDWISVKRHNVVMDRVQAEQRTRLQECMKK